MIIFTTVIIELAGGREPDTSHHVGRIVSVIAGDQGGQAPYGLYEGQQRLRQLSPEETAELLRLLSDVRVCAPWNVEHGFDGHGDGLIVRDRAYGFIIHWWVAPPPGWETAGAVFDYVVRLANNG